ncbi:MAG: hypothetical protein ACK2T6_09745 [Anaerolineae bacterium]
MTSNRLSPSALRTVVQVDSLDDLTARRLVELFRGEESLQPNAPDGLCQVDPRDGAVITYNSARARRPHDYGKRADIGLPNAEAYCPICDGKTTGAIDVAPLSDGFTFINKNMFPVLYLEGDVAAGAPPTDPTAGSPIGGLHLLQWTSTVHAHDFHNMPLADVEIVLRRLARLEGLLLGGAETILGRPGPAYVLVIKNYGPLVGGSLAHGHQQIALSSVMPRRMADNARFEEQHCEPFAAFMLRENPAELTVRDYGAARLVVPYFMRRPYDMMLLARDTSRRYLSELDDAEIGALAAAWQDATRAVLDVMPRIGRQPAYNVTVSNGPGAGLYVEFLPYTQETGGLEHLGLWACQNNPADVARDLRATIAKWRDGEPS